MPIGRYYTTILTNSVFFGFVSYQSLRSHQPSSKSQDDQHCFKSHFNKHTHTKKTKQQQQQRLHSQKKKKANLSKVNKIKSVSKKMARYRKHTLDAPLLSTGSSGWVQCEWRICGRARTVSFFSFILSFFFLSFLYDRKRDNQLSLV